MRFGRDAAAPGRLQPEGAETGDTLARERGRQGRTRIRAGWWIASAAALGGVLIAMYLYQKSLEDDFELLLRAALQQYLANDDNSEHVAEAEKP